MYTFPTAVINHVTYTAKRWGQAPTITYADGASKSVTAGHEIVSIASDLSDITIYIEASASTNLQIKTAITSADATVDSLYARDLVSLSIEGGHSTDTNATVTATTLSGAVSVAAPSITAAFPLGLSGSKAVVTDASGNLATSTATAAEIVYVHGVTSAVQTQLDAKEVSTNKDTTTSLGTSDTKYPSQKAVKAYADALPVVLVLASDPSSPTEGQVWYNTTSHLLKYFDGSVIRTVSHT